jgi:hypothetical protein
LMVASAASTSRSLVPSIESLRGLKQAFTTTV